MKLLLTAAPLFIGLFSVAQSFLPQNSGVSTQLNALDFSTPSTGIVVGNAGVIRKTVDSGLNWTASNSGTQIDLSGVAFVSGSTYIAVGKSGTIIKTTNSGTSWSLVNSGTSNDLTGIFVNGLNLYITGTNGTILISTNSGNAWTPINTGISFKLNKIYFVSEYTGYAVGDGGTILKTVNGGQVWNFQTSGTNTHSLTDIYFTDGNTGIVTGGISASNESIILRTTNAGSIWTFDNFTGSFLNALGFFPDHSVGYSVGGNVSGNASAILKTTNQGSSWIPVSSSFPRLLGVCFPGNGIGYTCGLNGTILRLANNTAGVEDVEDHADIQISPNPGKGVFTVSSSLNEEFSMEVFSAEGTQVADIHHSNTIDLSHSPSGIYYVFIRSEVSTFMRKLVKE